MSWGAEVAPQGLQSEREFQRKLHRPWAALLVERTHRAEARIQHLRRLPKVEVAKRWIDVTEIRVIENVERFGPKLHGEVLDDVKITSDSAIDLSGSKGSNEITRCVACGGTNRQSKCSTCGRDVGAAVDRPPTRVLRTIEIDRIGRVVIDSRVVIRPRRIFEQVSSQCDWKRRSDINSSVNSPVIEERIRNSVLIHMRDIPSDSCLEVVSYVKIGIAVGKGKGSICRTVVQRMRPGVGN